MHPLATIHRFRRVRDAICTAGIVLLATASATSAATTTYSGLDNPRGTFANSNAAFNNFTAALSSFGIDTIEGFAGFTPDPILTFGATGITAQTDVDYVAPFAPLAVSGANSLLDAGPGSSTGDAIDDTFTFNTPITAFGFYAANIGDASTANTVSLRLENTSLNTSKVVSVGTFGPGNAFDATVFFGVTDTDPFDKVTLLETFDFDGLLLDNVTAGYVIPEISSIALLSAGAILIAGLMRRRSSFTKVTA
jgi:hypothetical protein